MSTPVAGRGQAVLDPLVGMFVNTLVLRAGVESPMSFRELLEQVRVGDLDAFAHADVPLESVVEAVDPVRSEAFAPLAQVMLSFNPGASVAEARAEVGDLKITPISLDEVPAQVDLSVNVIGRCRSPLERCAAVRHGLARRTEHGCTGRPFRPSSGRADRGTRCGRG